MLQDDQATGSTRGFFQRWRDGTLAEKSGLATVALALVLVGTLLGAQWFVHSRSGQLQAAKNAETLLHDVAAQGLDQLLGRRPIVLYLLQEHQGAPVGFTATLIVPQTQDNGPVVFLGRELHYSDQEGIWQSSFDIGNDLRRFQVDLPYQAIIRLGRAQVRATRVRLTVDHGLLSLSYRGGQQWLTSRQDAIPLDQPNLIPTVLLDFFTSLAVRRFPKEGAVFALLDPKLFSQGALLTTEIRVRPGGEVPEDVKRATPDGLAAQTEMLTRLADETPTRQVLYYSSNHRLLWQKDLLDPPVITRAVSRADIEAAFPHAAGLLRTWIAVEDLEPHDTTESDQSDNPTDRVVL